MFGKSLRSRNLHPNLTGKQSNANVDGTADDMSLRDVESVEEVNEDKAMLLKGGGDPEIRYSKAQTAAKQGIAGDESSIAILLFLYVLQGIPLGLAAAVPLILSNQNVSYKQQAEFSFSYWPFSIKLLWAPIVDSCFVASFGRRKTWLVPVQYMIGLTMLLLAKNVKFYLEGQGNADNVPDVFSLTLMFFFLNFLAATQDIAVDGWALTMLQRHNVGYASTCNSVGQTAGYFLGYVGYVVLEGYDVVDLSQFLNFWGIVFLVSTTLVAVFKHEGSEEPPKGADKKDITVGLEEEMHLGVVDTYKVIFKMVTLPLMPMTIVFLLTSKIGFSAADAVTGLKLIEKGVPKEKMAMLAIPLIPLQILLPWLISRYTSGPRPMDVYIKAMTPRLLIGIVVGWIVWITPSFRNEDGTFPIYYYVMIILVYSVHQVFLYSMFVSIMALFARISDPKVGGTYMTFLNTLTNLGGNWPTTLALWWVDVLSTKQCVSGGMGQPNKTTFDPANICDSPHAVHECENSGGKCQVEVEGYYIESAVCVVIGFLWLFLWGKKTVDQIQDADDEAWLVVHRLRRRKRKR